MRWMMLAVALLAACDDDDTSDPICELPASSEDAGVIACKIWRSYLECGNCGCPSDDRSSCSFCSGTCSNTCAPHEYAVACGGPPTPGGPGYEQPPASCRGVLFLPSGTVISCCPCS